MSALSPCITLFLLPQILGWLFLSRLLSGWSAFAPVNRVILSQALGYGLQGLLFLAYRLLFNSQPIPLLVLAGLLVAGWFRFVRKEPDPPVSAAQQLPWQKLMLAGLALQALGSVTVLVLHWLNHPLGNMDAYSHWMLRARYLSDLDLWRLGFSPALNSPEYPLLFPAMIASASNCALDWQPLVTLWLETVLVAATGSVIYEGIQLLQGKRTALLGATIYLSAPWVLYRASCLYADTLVCFLFSLVTLVLLTNVSLSSRIKPAPVIDSRTLLGLGVLVGLAWLTKHEGVVFFANVLLTLVVCQAPRRAFLPLLGFVAPVLLLSSLHTLSRTYCVPALSHQSPLNLGAEALLSSLLSPQRYLLVLLAFLKFLTDVYWWNAAAPIVLVIFSGLIGCKKLSQRIAIAFIPVFLQFNVMIAYFLVSPLRLEQHLETAFPRLFLHTYPALLILIVGCWRTETGREEDSQV